MLDTSSSSAEIPLFGTMASQPSSCGMEAIVIQRPLSMESYSWSDFPIAMQDDSITYGHGYNHNYGYNASKTSLGCGVRSCESTSLISLASSTSSSTLSTCSSEASMVSLSSSGSIGAFIADQDLDSSVFLSSESSKRKAPIRPPRRNVRFAPLPMVRTYSLVLGDHPLCDDGLAIELGWDYDEDVVPASPQQQQAQQPSSPQQQQTQTHQTSHGCSRRSYLLRKQLLLDVAGCTKEELDQRTRDLEEERTRLERTRSHREDYFYGLAFKR